MNNKKNICVYCSSSNYLDEKFYVVSQEIGEKIATETGEDVNYPN